MPLLCLLLILVGFSSSAIFTVPVYKGCMLFEVQISSVHYSCILGVIVLDTCLSLVFPVPALNVLLNLLIPSAFSLDTEQPDYDLDSEDDAFVNKLKKKMEISFLQFEEMIDRLEKGSGQQVFKNTSTLTERLLKCPPDPPAQVCQPSHMQELAAEDDNHGGRNDMLLIKCLSSLSW